MRDAPLCTAIEGVFSTFEREVLPVADLFPTCVIMGDANNANIIVAADALAVVGIIDFGDATHTS